MRIIEGKISEHLDGIAALLHEHWQEIALNKSLMVLKPARHLYEALEQADAIFTLLLLDDLDQIVGYSVNVVGQHLHYADLTYSQNDVLFIAREHRGRDVGMLLIAATETKAKSLGSKLHLWHAKGDTALEALLTRNGYPVQDIVFSKEL